MTSITHDREYDVTQGKPGSRIAYFTANPNGEAESVRVMLKPDPRLRKTSIDYDFSNLAVKGRASRGNLITRNPVYRILLRAHGASTLGGRKVWFDHDVCRLNFDEHGQYLGEFHSEDIILVVLKNGEFYTTNFDPNNHYEQDILLIRKFNPNEVFTAVLFDAAQQNYLYIKRFVFEKFTSSRRQNFLGENSESQLVLLTDTVYPRLLLTYGGADSFREPLEIDVDSYIAVKGFKAKGKRITTCSVEKVTELEPLRQPESDVEPPASDEETSTNLNDETLPALEEAETELTGQLGFEFE